MEEKRGDRERVNVSSQSYLHKNSFEKQESEGPKTPTAAENTAIGKSSDLHKKKMTPPESFVSDAKQPCSCKMSVPPVPEMLMCGEKEMECGCGELAKVFEGGPVTTMETHRNTISKGSENATGPPDAPRAEPSEEASSLSTVDILPMPKLLNCSEEEVSCGSGELGKAFAGDPQLPTIHEEIEGIDVMKCRTSGGNRLLSNKPNNIKDNKQRSMGKSILGPLGQPIESFNTRLIMPFVQAPESMSIPSMDEWFRTMLRYSLQPVYIMADLVKNNPATSVALVSIAYALYLSIPLSSNKKEDAMFIAKLAAGVSAMVIAIVFLKHVNPAYWVTMKTAKDNDRQFLEVNEEDSDGCSRSDVNQPFKLRQATGSKKSKMHGRVLGKIESAAEEVYENLFGAAGDPGHEMVGDVYQEKESGKEEKVSPLHSPHSSGDVNYSSDTENYPEKSTDFPKDSSASQGRQHFAEQEGGYVSDSDIPGPVLLNPKEASQGKISSETRQRFAEEEGGYVSDSDVPGAVL